MDFEQIKVNKEALNERPIQFQKETNFEKIMRMHNEMILETYNQDKYEKEVLNIEKTINKEISSSNSSMDEKEVVQLKQLRNRDMSMMLLNEEKFSGDSDVMKSVKANIRTLEHTLGERIEFENINSDYFDNVIEKYNMAIAGCKHYCKVKNPFFPTGIKRKKMVQETMERMKEELKMMQHARELFESKQLEDKEGFVNCGSDILVLSQLHMDNNQEQKEDSVDSSEEHDINAALDLTYDDFASVLGTYNRGNIRLSNGKLEIIDNSYYNTTTFSEVLHILNPFGEDEKRTIDNSQLKRQLYKLASKKLENKNPNDLITLYDKLNMGKLSHMELLLSREKLADVIGFVNEASSEAKEVFYTKFRKVHDESQEETINRTLRIDAASAAYDIISIEDEVDEQIKEYEKVKKAGKEKLTGKEEEEFYKKKAKEKERLKNKARRKKIDSLLKVASKCGIEVPTMSDSKYDRMKCNYQLLIDKSYESMLRIVDKFKVLNKDNKTKTTDFFMSNPEIRRQISSIALCGMLSDTKIERGFYEEILRKYEDEIAIKYYASKTNNEDGIDEEQRQKNKELNTYNNNLQITEITVGGADGIEETVAGNLSVYENWKKNKENVIKGKNLLIDLFDKVKKVSELRKIGMDQGLDSEQVNLMNKLGVEVSSLMSDKDSKKLMELVVTELQDTRYLAGYNRLKEMKEDYGEMTSTFSEAVSIKEKKNVKPVEGNISNKTKISLEEKLEKVSTEARDIVSMLMYEKAPAELIKEPNDNYAKQIMVLRNKLNALDNGKLKTVTAKIGNETFKFFRNNDESLFISIGGQNIKLSAPASNIVSRLQNDFIENQNMYDKKAVRNIVKSAANAIILTNSENDNVAEQKVENKNNDNTVDENNGGIVRSNRRLCVKYLAKQTGKSENFFDNVSTDMIKKYTLDYCNGELKEEAIVNFVVQLDSKLLINNSNALEAYRHLKAVEAKKNSDVKDKVVITEKKELKKDSWNDDENNVIKFISDFIFDSNTFDNDEQQKKINEVEDNQKLTEKEKKEEVKKIKVDGMWDFLINHAEGLYSILRTDSIESLVKKMPDEISDMLLKGEDNILTKIKEIKKSINDNIPPMARYALSNKENGAKFFKNMLGMLKGANVSGFFANWIKDIKEPIDEAVNDLIDQEDSINAKVTELTGSIEEEIEKATNDVFGKKKDEKRSEDCERKIASLKAKLGEAIEEKPDNFDDIKKLLDGYAKYLTEEEWDSIVNQAAAIDKKHNTELKDDVTEYKLDKMISEEHVSGVQTNFSKKVLCSYFGFVSVKDKRRMVAEAVRSIKPQPKELLDFKEKKKENPKINDELPKEYLKKIENLEKETKTSTYGNLLGGVFKGSGPLLQKMLQGMPVESLPEELKLALDDVKSNLSPIPQKIVEANLLDYVERSKGKVSKVELVKSLGAASVGQAFLCKIYGEAMPQEGKEVVFKMLRPDVRNRMLKEEEIMLRCAREVDTEMDKSKNKNKNASKNEDEKKKDGGMTATYKGQLERIREELDLTIEAKNVHYGSIYDKGYYDVKAMKLDNTVETTADVMVLEKAPGVTVDKYIKNQNQFLKDFDELVNSQDYKDTLEKGYFTNISHILNSRKYHDQLKAEIENAKLYQKHLCNMADMWVREAMFGVGFYHGDLHAGNIMIDKNEATLIDFGNATKLSPKQTVCITRMISAATIGDADTYKDNFFQLMDKPNPEQIKKNEAEIDKILKEVLSLGSKRSVGKRITASLLKLQTLGIELPATVQNFAQSEMRVQNTISDMNKCIKDMEASLKKFEKDYENNSNEQNFGYTKEYKSKSLQGKDEFLYKLYDGEKKSSSEKEISEEIKRNEEKMLHQQIDVSHHGKSDLMKAFNTDNLNDIKSDAKYFDKMKELLRIDQAKDSFIKNYVKDQLRTYNAYYTASGFRTLRNNLKTMFKDVEIEVSKPNQEYNYNTILKKKLNSLLLENNLDTLFTDNKYYENVVNQCVEALGNNKLKEDKDKLPEREVVVQVINEHLANKKILSDRANYYNVINDVMEMIKKYEKGDYIYRIPYNDPEYQKKLGMITWHNQNCNRTASEDFNKIILSKDNCYCKLFNTFLSDRKNDDYLNKDKESTLQLVGAAKYTYNLAGEEKDEKGKENAITHFKNNVKSSLSSTLSRIGYNGLFKEKEDFVEFVDNLFKKENIDQILNALVNQAQTEKSDDDLVNAVFEEAYKELRSNFEKKIDTGEGYASRYNIAAKNLLADSFSRKKFFDTTRYKLYFSNEKEREQKNLEEVLNKQLDNIKIDKDLIDISKKINELGSSSDKNAEDQMNNHLANLGERQNILTKFGDMSIDRAIYDSIGKVCNDKKIKNIESLSDELKNEILKETMAKLNTAAKREYGNLMDYSQFINSLKDRKIKQDEFGKNQDEMFAINYLNDEDYSKYEDVLMKKLVKEKVKEPNGNTKYIVNTDYVTTLKKSITEILAKGSKYEKDGDDSFSKKYQTTNEFLSKIGIDNSGAMRDFTVSKIQESLDGLVKSLESGKRDDLKLVDFLEWYNKAVSYEIAVNVNKYWVRLSDNIDENPPELEDINSVMADVISENMMVALKRNGKFYSIKHYNDFHDKNKTGK